MTGQEHFRRAEELAAKAGEYLGQGDGQDTAAVWAAVAQVHATLAVAAAISPRPANATRPLTANPQAGSRAGAGVPTRQEGP
jgi:hypothetical protein